MNKKWSITPIIVALILSLSLTGCTTTTPELKVSNEPTIIEEKESKPLVKVEEKDSLYSNRSSELQNSDVVQIDENSLEVDGKIFVRFIDVGQGDSCVIVTPNNDIILVDAGDKKDASEIIEDLGCYSFEDIDLMILSHPHADHIGGATTLLNTYETKEIVMCSYPATSKLFTTLLDTIEDKDIKLTQGTAGLTYNIDGVYVEVLAADTIPKDSNNSSLLVKVTYGDIDILFTGDIENQAEDIILNNECNIEAEILKLGHHGSDTSTSDRFLDSVNPTLGVISVGEGNQYKHPATSTVEKLKSRNIQYYRTDKDGSIELEIDGVNILYNLTDSLEVTSLKSNLFIFAPTLAEVHLEDEEVVIQEVTKNN